MKWGVLAALILLLLGAAWLSGWPGAGAPKNGGDNEAATSASDGAGSPDSENMPSEMERQVNEMLARMSLNERISQLLIVDLDALGREQAGESAIARLQALQPGGVVLFRKNLPDARRTITQNRELQQTARIPLWIGIDEEGGPVTRLSFANDGNGNMAIAASGDTALAAETAHRISGTLEKLEFNLNFAPVADVNSNANNPVIGLRSFGSDPEAVGAYVQSFISGMHQSGLPAVVKHFPGHGDTATDSHAGLPKLSFAEERFEEVEWVPFRAAIEAGADMIMSAHIQAPKLEPSAVRSKKDGSLIALPATLSPHILTGILREKLNFRGAIVTDALNMKAISDHFGSDEAAVLALQAGADVLLMPPQPDAAVAGIRKAIDEGKLSAERIEESVRRILRIKLKYGVIKPQGRQQPLETEKAIHSAEQFLSSAESHQLADRIASQALTPWGTKLDAYRNQAFIQPEMKVITVIGHEERSLEQVRRAIEAAASSLRIGAGRLEFTSLLLPDDKLAAAVQSSDAIVLVARDIYVQPEAAGKMKEALKLALDSKKPAAVIAAGTPYDMAALSEAPVGFAIYGVTASNVRAGARALFHDTLPPGKLPVVLPKQGE
ncbi:glycoside hydrolase family 3 protein [Paenibacillus apiarius]|uniref:glycoside hydrolase family 3 protein n=1 Tax=Paenibacillus apiarius TaxID=46240 RepID=UPI003B3A1E0B